MTKTFEILNFGHCDLFDICVLGFGIFSIKALNWSEAPRGKPRGIFSAA